MVKGCCILISSQISLIGFVLVIFAIGWCQVEKRLSKSAHFEGNTTTTISGEIRGGEGVVSRCFSSGI